jgi:hypothetical protein
VYPFLLSSTHAPFAPHGMLFIWFSHSSFVIASLVLLLMTNDIVTNDRPYCCLLFFSITSSNMSKNVLLVRH